MGNEDRISIREIKLLDGDPSSRQELIPGWDQERIKNSKVLVVGAGALGNELIKNLILLGVGEIRVIDFDKIVHSNLSRSVLFAKEDADLSRDKVEAIMINGKKLDPYGYVKLLGYNLDVTKIDHTHEVFKGIDVVFTALDNFEARLHVNSQAYYLGIPLIDGGMDGPMGHVQVVVPPYTSCLSCSLTPRDYKALSARLRCDGVPTDLFTPKTPAVISTTAVVAGIMTHEFVKVILGIDRFRREGKWNEKIGYPLAGKRIFINLSIPAFVVYDVPISKSCPLHMK